MKIKKVRKTKTNNGLRYRLAKNLSLTWNQKRPVFLFVGGFFFLMVLFYAWWMSDYFLYTINPRLAFINSGISSWVLNLLGQETMVNGDIVYSPVFSISVKRGCDAIEAMALFSAAILAFPNSWKGKLLNLFFGLVLLFTLNIFRIVSLFLTGVYSPKAFDLMHIEVWQALFVFIALGLWLYFIRKSRIAGKNASQ